MDGPFCFRVPLPHTTMHWLDSDTSQSQSKGTAASSAVASDHPCPWGLDSLGTPFPARLPSKPLHRYSSLPACSDSNHVFMHSCNDAPPIGDQKSALKFPTYRFQIFANLQELGCDSVQITLFPTSGRNLLEIRPTSKSVFSTLTPSFESGVSYTPENNHAEHAHFVRERALSKANRNVSFSLTKL